jgi:hypothetical protein
MPHSVNSSEARMVRNVILMLQSEEEAGQGLSRIGFQYSSPNCSKMRIIRDTMLMLQRVEVAGQRLSGIDTDATECEQ